MQDEKPTIVAGFCKGDADEEKTIKAAKNVLVSKAPLCKGSCRGSD